MAGGVPPAKGLFMDFEITMVDVWTAELEDRPGTLAEKVEALQRAGANLEFAILRPSADVLSSIGLLFVAPIVGPAQTRAAEEAGLKKNLSLHALRIVGPNRPGLIAGIARTLADARINVTALWAAAIGERGALYFRFESNAEARRANQLLVSKLG
jgi:hypothetical protein